MYRLIRTIKEYLALGSGVYYVASQYFRPNVRSVEPHK